jgi:hypothetical protein
MVGNAENYPIISKFSFDAFRAFNFYLDVATRSGDQLININDIERFLVGTQPFIFADIISEPIIDELVKSGAFSIEETVSGPTYFVITAKFKKEAFTYYKNYNKEFLWHSQGVNDTEWEPLRLSEELPKIVEVETKIDDLTKAIITNNEYRSAKPEESEEIVKTLENSKEEINSKNASRSRIFFGIITACLYFRHVFYDTVLQNIADELLKSLLQLLSLS